MIILPLKAIYVVLHIFYTKKKSTVIFFMLLMPKGSKIYEKL